MKNESEAQFYFDRMVEHPCRYYGIEVSVFGTVTTSRGAKLAQDAALYLAHQRFAACWRELAPALGLDAPASLLRAVLRVDTRREADEALDRWLDDTISGGGT